MRDAKSRHLRTIVQLCRAISSQLKHVSTIEKKLVKLQMSSQCGELRPTSAAEIDQVVWGTAANFNGFRVLAALLHGSHFCIVYLHLFELRIENCSEILMKLTVFVWWKQK